MSQTVPRNPVIPNGPGDLRNRFPSQPNPYNIPAYPSPPSRPYTPVTGGTPPSLNPFANRNGVSLPGVPKTPGGNYVGPRPYSYTQNLPRGVPYPPALPKPPRWINPALQPGFNSPTHKPSFNWSINTRSRPNLPALPRSPGLNPRWPRWARIPPSMRIPLIGGLANLGLGILRPNPVDILFGIIPDAMEASRPWVWQQLGIKPPGSSGSGGSPLPPPEGTTWALGGTPIGEAGIGYGLSIDATIFEPERPGQQGSLTYPFVTTVQITGPFVGVTEHVLPTGTNRWSKRWVWYTLDSQGNLFAVLSRDTNRFAYSAPQGPALAEQSTITFNQLTLTPNNLGSPIDALTTQSGSSSSINLTPTNGIQPGTPPFPGMPASIPGTQRPSTDPRTTRPDLQPVPQTSAQPRVEAQQQSNSQNSDSTVCRFSPASQAEIDSLRNQIRSLQEQNRDLQDQLTAANQATFYQVPYVVENEQGQRVRQNYALSLRGLVDTTAVAALSNQTADWAMQTGNKTEKIYQILGGDSTWGNQPTPQAETNPDALLRSQPVINEQGLGSMVQAMNLPQLFTQTQAVLYQRQGLQQFPITVQPPQLNAAGLLPEASTPQVFRTATDVTVTTSSKGFAVIKGLNEVITKTQQTIQYLRIDRLLNLLNTAATLHNAAMLSRNLVETLNSTISNVLATFGLRDATGQPFDFGSILGNTVQEFLKSILGESTVNGINENWNKANRILSAASGIIFALRSIGDSILSALSIGFGWVARIGNALELAGVIHERFWSLVNPTPNFSNRFFTGIEAAENLLGNIDSVAGEAQSITESVSDIARNREDMGKMLSGENQPNASNIHAPTNTQAIQTKADSQGAPVTLPDVVPPSPN